MGAVYFLLIFLLVVKFGGSSVVNNLVVSDQVGGVFILLTLVCGVFLFHSLRSGLLNLLVLSLALSFSVNAPLLFYVFFEFSIFPMLLMMVGGGKTPERLSAGSFLLLYTAGASLPLLLVLLCGLYDGSHLGFGLPKFLVVGDGGWVFCLCFLGAFLVKLPVYGLHLWLPKAHVEATTSGSVVLAAVMLKLGVYGMMRFPPSLVFFGSGVGYGWLLCGLLLSGLSCFRSNDYKVLVAYSSVAHMGLVLFCFLGGYLGGLGCGSAVIIVVGHGVASGLLFTLVDFFYSLVGSRSLVRGVGCLVGFSLVSLVVFLSASLNMGFPPTMTFWGEILVIGHSLKGGGEWVFVWWLVLYVFMVGLYSLYLYVVVTHSFSSSLLSGFISVKPRYEALSYFLVVGGVFLLAFPKVFL